MNSIRWGRPAPCRVLHLPRTATSRVILSSSVYNWGVRSNSRLNVPGVVVCKVEEGRSMRSTPATLHSTQFNHNQCPYQAAQLTYKKQQATAWRGQHRVAEQEVSC